jgi:DNA-binding transcriptional ArsR family regulator
MDDTQQMAPAGLRAHAFAGVELMLDLIYASRVREDIDVEHLLIYFSIAEATMRPMLLNPETPPAVLDMAYPPDAYRGSITRLLVADRLNLPRETVRRKVHRLIELGLVEEDEQGRVRTTRRLVEDDIQAWARNLYAAVQRYDARLRQLGRAGVAGPRADDREPYP